LLLLLASLQRVHFSVQDRLIKLVISYTHWFGGETDTLIG